MATSAFAVATPPRSGPDGSSVPSPPGASTLASRAATPLVVVHGRTAEGKVRPDILGVNTHSQHNGLGTWNSRRDRPRAGVVAGLRRAGATLVRYPGGIAANLFDWKEAIGRHRGCQIDGRVRGDGSYRGFAPATYGVDENEELVRAAGAKTSLMVPFPNESPRDAADWVEYMNSPSGTAANPNGGIDYAEVRARNGHPRPYHIHRWEIGNEQRLRKQRYWMADSQAVALKQYIRGAIVRIGHESLGKDCSHPNAGITSNGRPNQTFEMLYAPVAQRGTRLNVNGRRWTQVADVDKASPGQRVYELSGSNGKVLFGDGRHGRIPGRGAHVRATYTSVHKGVFRFIRAMQDVDPSIQVCVAWGLVNFVDAAGKRRYGCFTAHVYTLLTAGGHGHWRSAVEGHDLGMLGTVKERRPLVRLRRHLPARVELPITEFGTLQGDSSAFPTWGSSMSRALYFASQWVDFMDLDVAWAEGEDVILAQRGLLGSARRLTFSASAVARRAVTPMLRAGGHQIKVRVRHNPLRNPRAGRGRYPALKVAATRTRRGDLYMLVVNRLPFTSVRTRVALEDFRGRRRAVETHVTSRTFASSNPPGGPAGVRLTRSRRGIGSTGFLHSFPAHSITVIKIAKR